jgi:3-hydroxy-9,10-secoandrosta-1,3,5(10)-triene-9,17-dione monooxygenase
MDHRVDRAEILRRVGAIAPALERNSRACDDARQVVPESMRAMVEAGVFRIPQPARVGGYELNLRTLADAVTGLSQACPSSGWVLMVMGAHHWCMGGFPERAQEDVFGVGRDGLVAGTLSWQGTAADADGGYRVEGRWQFGSGIDHANWVMLGCADPDTHGPKVHVVIPREEIEVDDTWRVLGLRGSGSKDLIANDIFVPVDRAIDTRLLFSGASPHAASQRTNLYKLSAESMLSMSVATAVLGSAKFALEKFVERTRERRVVLTGARKAEHAPTQVRLAEAAGEIQAAELMQHHALAEFDRMMEAGTHPTFADRARAKWAAAYSAELCRRAVARMFTGSGAHFDSSAEMYARWRLGVMS